MEYKEIFGLISAVVALGVSLSYIYTMVRGNTRPHLYSIAIDALTSTVVLAGSFAAGAGAGIWNLVVATVLVYVMVILCFRYGTKDVTALDAVFASAAVLTVIPWLLTKDPTLSVVLASSIAILSMLPAVRKTWNDPHSEPWAIWGVNAVKHMIAIPATSVFSVATLVYPICIISTNLLFVAMMLYRRKATLQRN
jgi:hypothetical protein